MSSLALEEYELLEDPKYRAYVAIVDKALRNFESTSEWADLISTLGKLNKVLLSHMKYPVVPRRIIISKRLAQCLHPALPSGVHLKALEIYDVIFKCMGTNRLSQELFIYSAGLFPLFNSAAMNVRSALLTIYENHFVPLGSRLRPGLNGFLAGTLSGLEESSDHVERTSVLLQRVAEGVGQAEFFGCLWECILSNTNVRLPAINHISSCFNRKLSTEDQLFILGTNVDVMVRGLCQALEDSAVLVQRAALDLTLLLLPMHNTQLLRSDLTSVVASSLIVLLRRDMSLNRRIFAWLLGSEVNISIFPSEHPVVKKLVSLATTSEGGNSPRKESYFQGFSQSLLVEAFISTLKVAVKSKDFLDLRPYKIIIPLLDKPEIGPYILDKVILDLLRCIYHMSKLKENDESISNILRSVESESSCSTSSVINSKKNIPKRPGYELTKSILLVFSSLQPNYPWYRLLSLLNECCHRSSVRKKQQSLSNDEKNELDSIDEDGTMSIKEVGSVSVTVIEVCNLLGFLMKILPLDTQQHIQGARLHDVLLSVTCLLNEYIEVLSVSELYTGLKVCKLLLEKLIPSVTHNIGSQVEIKNNTVNPTTYPTNLYFKPNVLSEFSSKLENGIIQIGIEAEVDLNKKGPVSKETTPTSSRGEEELEIIECEEADSDSDYKVHDESQISKITDKQKSGTVKSDALYSSDSQLTKKSEDVNDHYYSLPTTSNFSDSFETELPYDYSEHILDSTIISENDSDGNFSNPDVLESSFLYKYMKEFKKLFLLLIEKVLISPESLTISDFEKVLFSQVSHSNKENLDLLMKKCLLCIEGKNVEFSEPQDNFSKKQFSSSHYDRLATCITLHSTANLYLPVLKIACTILIELSSVPVAITFPRATFISSGLKQSLPRWALCLLACIVSGHQVSPLFTQTSISTLLELLALAKSDLSAWKNDQQSTADSEEGQGVVTLRMLPLLTPIHIYAILHNTYVFHFMSHELWHHLNPRSPQYHLLSAELLLQLHSLSLPQQTSSNYTPQDFSIVEREVLRFLTFQRDPSPMPIVSQQHSITWCRSSIKDDCDGSAILSWITLWQVSRNLSRSIIQSYPYLNRCLFLMIERLESQSVLERSYSQNWLMESLNFGDLGRILDPVLVYLLQSHTRRVSVQHINIEKIIQESRKQTSVDIEDCSATESQIFAISSVKGEVIYHIGKGSPVKLKKRKQNVFKKQVFAFTSIADEKNKFVTKQINLPNYETPVHNKHNSLPISLMVNPFSRHPWIDIDDLTKINKSTSDISKVTNATRPKENKTELSKVTSKDIAKDIVNEIIEKAMLEQHKDQMRMPPHSPTSSSFESVCGRDVALHPLHSHMLLYMELIDAGQHLYALRLIKNILNAQPKLFLLSLASTSINLQNNSSPLLILLSRHRCSVFGEGFDCENVSDTVGQFRSTMYLQVLITVCLYFIRSYYPQQPHLHVHQEHLRDNRELQVAAAEVLQLVFTQLIPLVVDSPRGFSPYVKDLLNKCKVQKCVLHCLLSLVHIMNENSSSNKDIEGEADIRTFSQDILEFNFNFSNSDSAVPQEQSYLFCLMDLTLALIKLEDAMLQSRSDATVRDLFGSFNSKKFTMSSLKYTVGHSIPSQPMFLWCFVLVLSQKNLRHFHSSWMSFFTASLPHTSSALPLNCLRIITLICALLEELADYYKNGDDTLLTAPTDYTLHLLSGLMSIVHFCLLDPAQSPISTLPSYSSMVPPMSPVNQSTGQILYNLLHVFSPAGEILDASLDTSTLDPLLCARKTVLSHLPRLVSSLLSLWICTRGESNEEMFIMGNRQTVRQQLIELLSPVCHHHTPHLLAAVAVVWQGLMDTESEKLGQRNLDKKLIWNCTRLPSSAQLSLVEMLAALKVLPLHTLVENVKQVFINPPTIEGGGVHRVPLEVSVLQLFYLYVKETASVNQLSVCLSPLLSMVREGITCLPAPALLVLLASLNEFIQRSPVVQDRKEIKEQQDVTVKLLDAVSAVAGSKLESTNWLRRNLTVKTESSSDPVHNENTADTSTYSVAALSVLAELLAPMLDVLYSSEEKERVIPLLTNIMANVIPYLRNHSLSNMSAFHACSQLLSSLSSYQYTLKAWRKDVLELLLDSSTFKMLPETVPYWRSLIDNLCTQDKAIFKELLSRISVSQGGSLNLFTNKETEYEIRANLLKRLAFAIFCSETDQYLKLIPDIQERLTEVTRLGQVIPSLVAQVFLCFRVLLLRISPRGTTSLWPIVITELVQVLLLIEQELSTDTEQFGVNFYGGFTPPVHEEKEVKRDWIARAAEKGTEWQKANKSV